MNSVTIELNSDFDIGDEISVKVPEGILTMAIADIKECYVSGDDYYGNCRDGTVYWVAEVEDVKVNGAESNVYTNNLVNENLTNGLWSISYTK
jgi:hypothetical protein